VEPPTSRPPEASLPRLPFSSLYLLALSLSQRPCQIGMQ
jgi:hypothetical protein